MRNLMFIPLIITAVILTLFSFCKDKNAEYISIEWHDNLEGDYSFTEKWSYPENIFLNQYGQLVCDSFCDSEVDRMRDENGRILPDSIDKYYQLIDTTHIYHSISCEAQCYEWIGTDFAHVYRQNGDTVKGYTECNVATHSSLQFTIIGDKCIPKIELNSVTPSGLEYFNYTDGFIKIDKQLWAKGIFKAEFSFTFHDTKTPDQPMWWKGKIYTKIKREESI